MILSAIPNSRPQQVKPPINWVSLIIWIIIAACIGGFAGAGLKILFGPTTTTFTQVISPPFEGKRLFRIIALGEDKSPAGVPGRTDTIIVVAVDLTNKTVRAISIPRDTRVYFPKRGDYDKINSAFVRGGYDEVKAAAERLLNVGIDYYIKTDIEGLKKTVDILGGVEIDIEKNMRYTDRRGGLYINLKKGTRLLNGDQALQYIRFRHDAMGDITRIQRQQKFLRAIARKAFTMESISKLPAVVREVRANIETDMSDKDLLELVRLAKEIPPDDIQMETLPGLPQNIQGISYWIPDETKAAEMVDRLLRFEPPMPKPANAAPTENNTEVSGQ